MNCIIKYAFFLLLFAIEISAQQLKLIYPNGGEILFSNRPALISWASDSSFEPALEFSEDGGKNWTSIYYYLQKNDHDYVWKLRFIKPSDSCLIRIYDRIFNSIADTSDTFFRILPRPDYSAEDRNDLSINNIRSILANTGEQGLPALLWNRRNQKEVWMLWYSGYVMTTEINGELTAAGGDWYTSLLPGNINNAGLPSNPNNPDFKIWKLRKNLAGIENDSIRQELKYNYDQWPVELGAPWEDISGDGVYTQIIDKPAILGDEQLFYVANDADTLTSLYAFEKKPIGVEFQYNSYAFDRANFLDNVIFNKILIINKSDNYFRNTYFTIWAYVWIGDGLDDFVGCDSTKSLAYGYNNNKTDEELEFRGIEIPPAIGHLLLQGPVVESSITDSAFYKQRWIRGFKNLGMTSFGPFNDDVYPYYPPISGMYHGIDYINSIKNLQTGHIFNGDPYLDPTTGKITNYPLYGNPETGEGWLEEDIYEGEQAYYLNMGPFDMAPGDTQEVAFAVIVAQGTNNLNSVTVLKEIADSVYNFYYDSLITANVHSGNVSPKFPKISQNYPNPFNSETAINYSVTNQSNVQIKIYDILGREVKTLINKMHSPGNYLLRFDLDNLPSGVYFYRILYSGFSETKKMTLLK